MEIEALVSEVNRLASSVQFWEMLSFICVVVTAIAAVGYGATSYVLRKQQAAVADAQARLIKAKDEGFRLRIERVRTGAKTDAERIDADSKRRIAEVETDAAKKIAESNRLAADANRTAEEEKLERIKLEAKIVPRRLTRAQQLAIAVGCRDIRAQQPIDVVSYSLDGEGAILAKQIIDSLRAGGVPVEVGIASQQPAGMIAFAVHVYSDDKGLGAALVNLLRTKGGLVVAAAEPAYRPPTGVYLSPNAPISATILVGVKPITD